MLPYFPTPFPGELVYSLVARYQRHVGIRAPSIVNEVVFGEPLQRPNYELPIRLGVLSSRIPARYGLTASRLARRHTLFPYYRALCSLEEAKFILAGMIGNTAISDYCKLGGPISKPNHLSFCSACASDMIHRYGEMYWLREHQLAGVKVCLIHNLILKRSNVKAGSKASQYIAASRSTCPPNAPDVIASTSEIFSDLMLIAKKSIDIMNSGQFDLNTQSDFLRRTRTLCQDKALTVGLNRISEDGIRSCVYQRFFHLESVWPSMFINKIGENLSKSGRLDWIRRVTRNSEFRIHPVYKILIEEALLSLPDVDLPFGSGPWPCLNPLAEHFQTLTINSICVRRTNNRWIGQFKCICGYVYTRSSIKRGQIEPPRLKIYGPDLDMLVRSAINQGMSISEAARRAKIDPYHLRDRAAALGIGDAWPSRSGSRGGYRDASGRYRPFHTRIRPSAG